MDDLSTAAFWKAALIRALWTFAQTLLAALGVDSAGFFNASILDKLMIAATAAVVSLLKSIVLGVPEAETRT